MTETIEKTENKLFKYITPIMLGLIFSLIGVIYTIQTLKIAKAEDRLTAVEQDNISKARSISNLEWNVYLLCINQIKKIECKKPEIRWE